MRKGKGAGEAKDGGAWASSATTRQDDAQVPGWSTACTIPRIRGENETLSVALGWPRAA